jgi:predicted nucleic acid-binding protein
MYKKVFLDANIIVDVYDNKRPSSKESKQVIAKLLDDESVQIYTSCDIITTLYYVLSKHNREKTLDIIIEVNEWCNVIEFGNKEIRECCTLMKNDTKYRDLEDTIQYIIAKKVSADLILSNDKGFVSDDIELLMTKDFLKNVNQKNN